MTDPPLRLADFNRLAPDDAVAVVRPCFEVERWWTTVVDSRPYVDLESLLEVARRSARPLTRRELELALAAYLGLPVDDWRPVDEVARLETEESAAELRERVAEDSRSYLVRFGRPVGRTRDAALEIETTAVALRQIGLLALTRKLAA